MDSRKNNRDERCGTLIRIAKTHLENAVWFYFNLYGKKYCIKQFGRNQSFSLYIPSEDPYVSDDYSAPIWSCHQIEGLFDFIIDKHEKELKEKESYTRIDALIEDMNCHFERGAIAHEMCVDDLKIYISAINREPFMTPQYICSIFRDDLEISKTVFSSRESLDGFLHSRLMLEKEGLKPGSKTIITTETTLIHPSTICDDISEILLKAAIAIKTSHEQYTTTEMLNHATLGAIRCLKKALNSKDWI